MNENINKKIGWKMELLIITLAGGTVLMYEMGWHKLVAFLLIWTLIEISARQAKHLGY